MRKRIFLDFKKTYLVTETADAAVYVIFIHFLCFYFYHSKVGICGAVVPNTKRVCPFHHHVFEISQGNGVSFIRQARSKSAAESA